MKRILLVLFLSALFPFVSMAQGDREVKKTVKVYFRQGSSSIDENYMDNKATLRDFAAEVESYYADSTARFRQIYILSSVSPEGSAQINERIAKQRAEAIATWISREIDVKVGYSVESMGVDWALFADLVQNSTKDVPYRNELLEILLDAPAEGAADTRFNRLVKLHGGVPYRWVSTHLFPQLRYASAQCEFWWEPASTITITSMPERMSAGGGAGVATYSKSVADEQMPVVTSNAAWVTPIESPEGEICFVVAPNRSTEPRTTTLSVEYYDTVHEVHVEQDGAVPSLTITSPSPVNFDDDGGNDVITYEKNVDDDVLPVASCDAEWIDSITSTPDGITYNVTSNNSVNERSATILVESYGEQHPVEIVQAGIASDCQHPFFMSIKTNMLYDVAAVPNIGAEFYLGKNFSVAANYMHAWWSKESKNFYWRYYGADVSVRWWFGKPTRVKPLQGHHIGVNYQILTYDFQLGNKGVLAGMPGGNLIDRANHIVALEYGYSLPIARRLNLDFGIGFGYHWGLFEEYVPIDGHQVWQATKRRRYLGPTKLEVSLVWLIGCGNYNKDKGGRR